MPAHKFDAAAEGPVNKYHGYIASHLQAIFGCGSIVKSVGVALLRLRLSLIAITKSDPNLSAILAMVFMSRPYGDSRIDAGYYTRVSCKDI